MSQTRYLVLGFMLLAILAVGLLAFWYRSPPEETDEVRVISAPAGDARSPAPANPSNVSTQAASPPAPADDLTALVMTSFPALRNVITRCEASHCEIVASTDVPAGGNALSSYEDMVRHELASILRAHGHILTEAVQIEETGGDQVRLRIRVSR